MQSLDRRNALTTLGLAGAVALVTPAAVIAANPEDAELKRLRNEWKAQWAYSLECGHAFTAVEESVFDAVGPHWRLDSVITPRFKSCDTFQARFIARRNGKEISQLLPVDALDMTEAYELAEKRLVDFIKKERTAEKSAKRRCGFRAAELAYDRSLDKVRDVESAIAEATRRRLARCCCKACRVASLELKR
jgi:hypothetical protein